MYDITNSVLWLGMVVSLTGVVFVPLSLVGGPLADRMDKRTILIAGNLAVAGLCLIIGGSISADIITGWYLLGAAVFWGHFMGLVMPASLAAVGQLVRRETLLNAVSWSNSARQITRIAAPFVVGLVIGSLGVDVVYYIMAGVYLLTASALHWLPRLPPQPQSRSPSLAREALEGLDYVKSSPILVLLVGSASLGAIFGLPVQFLLPVFAEDILDVGPQGLGVLAGMGGLGAALAVLVTASLGDYRHKGILLLGSTVAQGVSTILFALSRSYGLSVAMMVPVGFSMSMRVVLTNALLQSNVEERVRGRVMGIFHMTFGANSFTFMPITLLATLLGVPLVVALCGGIVLASGVMFAVAAPVLRRLP